MKKIGRIDKIAAVIVVLGLLAGLLIYSFAAELESLFPSNSGVEMAYETELFGTGEVITVDILISEEDWQELLETAINETWYACDVAVNGVTYKNVGIRAKGNTSLSQVYSDSTTDRYSFKIEFDRYISGQTCMGLDKLALNNNISDASSMKEYLVYDMFEYLDVAASLAGYASVSVNGETRGLYLALEAVEGSFAQRNYGTNYGQIYKPDNMNMGGAGAMREFDMDEWNEMVEGRQDEQRQRPRQDTDSTQQPESGAALPEGEEGGFPSDFQPGGEGLGGGQGNMGGGGGFGGASGGADLNYTDDDLDSYSSIWDGSVFTSDSSDHEKVVEALKSICQGVDLEQHCDVDSVLRYLAVHTFSVNLDSLTGNMAHNYYLAENDGALSIVPWDYNLAFGGFQSGGASDVVNFPIDTPFSSGLSESDRQFFYALLNVPEYLELYHGYLQQLVDGYVFGGELERVYENVRSQIDGLVAEDPTAFYSYEEYDAAAEMLYELICLRAESIAGQLNGSIPSTTDGQSADSSALADASSIDLNTIGGMNMGGGFGGGMDGGAGFEGSPPDAGGDAPPNTADSENPPLPSGEDFTQGGAQIPEFGQQAPQEGSEAPAFNQEADRGGAFPAMMGGGNMQGGFSSSESSSAEDVYWMAGYALLMAAALTALIFFRRKRRLK